MKLSPICAVATATLLELSSCKPATGPLVDAEAGIAAVEAGLPVATGICTLLEGIDSSGTLTTLCATIEEVAQVVAFVLTLRKADDAGLARVDTVNCTPLPLSTICASKPELGKAISFLVQKRRALLMLDGGAR